MATKQVARCAAARAVHGGQRGSRAGRPAGRVGITAAMRPWTIALFGVLITTGSLSGMQREGRRWFADPVATATMVDQDGTLFGDPARIIPLPSGGFAIVDRDDTKVRAFLGDGTPAWTFGRSGSGPGEFSFIQDIDVSTEGEVLVLDRGRRRATIIDAESGGLLTSFRIRSGAGTYGILPSGGDGRVLVTTERDPDKTLWLSIAEDGDVLESAAMPADCNHQLVCEFFATATGRAGSAIAFRWSSQLILLDPDGSVRAVVDGIEDVPFPEVMTYTVNPPEETGIGPMRVTRVDTLATAAALGVSGDEVHLFVSFAGSTEDRRRIVDVYTVADGRYRGSLRFPHDLADLAILSDGRLATLDLDFFPTVVLWDVDLVSQPRRGNR